MIKDKFLKYRAGIVAKKQRGSFMLFTLVIIALLTSVSVVGMQNTIQASRLTQSYTSFSLAQQRAQSALFKAYNYLNNEDDFEVNDESKPVIAGLYPQLVTIEGKTLSAWRYVDRNDLWRDDRYVKTFRQAEQPSINQDYLNSYLSSYIIEEILKSEKEGAFHSYRITAKGYGLSDSTQIMLQAMVDLSASKRQLSWSIVH